MQKLSREIFQLLSGSGLTLSTAESCTGGGIAAAIVAPSGASGYFKGGVVSYCNEIKEKILGVNSATIAQYNVVSAEVAREMCIGVLDAIGTDYAVSVTGCAGPGGGTDQIPVGTIWIGYGTKDNVMTYKLAGNRDREQNLEHATRKALELIARYIRDDMSQRARHQCP